MVTLLVPLISVVVSATVAILVPLLTFAHNRKMERIRLLTTARAELYVDALAEAHAERTWVEHDLAARIHGLNDPALAPADTRLPPAERARLGARMVAFGDPKVRDAWHRTLATAGPYSLLGDSQADLVKLRIEMDAAMRDLEQAVHKAVSADS